MTDKPQDQASPKSLFIDWMKTATAYWGSMASMWTGVAEKAEAATTSKKGGKKSRVQESWETIQKTWQALSEVMSNPETLEVAKN